LIGYEQITIDEGYSRCAERGPWRKEGSFPDLYGPAEAVP
jgi:hypothetical protein